MNRAVLQAAVARRLRQFSKLYRLLGALDRIDSLEERLSPLMPTREEFDALKSKLDVPQSMLDEFKAWKASTPIPGPNPLVSVVVNTYNREELLMERCVSSILRQTYKNFELLIVGDCCTDRTEERVRAIGDSRIYFENLSVRGVYPEDPYLRWLVAGAAPMNRALDLAKGSYITHLDDDDEYTPDRLEKLVNFARATSADLVWHPYWRETAEGIWKNHEALEFAHYQVTNTCVFYRSWLGKIRPTLDSYKVLEGQDQSRFRRMRYLEAKCVRCPEYLLRHYKERARCV